MKENAEAKLGEPVTEAVSTVPAYFNDAQRQPQGRRQDCRSRRAAHHHEPPAAALAMASTRRTSPAPSPLRPGRRHLRHFRARDRRRCVRGESDQCDTFSAAKISTCGWLSISPTNSRRKPDRPQGRQACPPAPKEAAREGQDRALFLAADRSTPLHLHEPQTQSPCI